MKKNPQRPLVRMGLSLLLLLATQIAPAQAVEIKLQRQGEYTFITGGQNDDETAAMDAQAPKYPIQLTFRNKGETLGVTDVKVRVKNVKGDVEIDTVSRGPYLYINPPASGRFTIEAELGEEKFSMTRDLVGRRYLHLLFEFGRAKKE